MSPERGIHYELIELRKTIDEMTKQIADITRTLKQMNVRVQKEQ